MPGLGVGEGVGAGLGVGAGVGVGDKDGSEPTAGHATICMTDAPASKSSRLG
jgi:hypothetical protein